ncbi:glycosyltransferase family 4 protein [Yunchengibacter salinarum]|uniref:glycosyltransferase family 4 protein n=1 Tax=Yunchengibacter salinarum TaxID=3133399 RepID=UPI0035B67DC1
MTKYYDYKEILRCASKYSPVIGGKIAVNLLKLNSIKTINKTEDVDALMTALFRSGRYRIFEKVLSTLRRDHRQPQYAEWMAQIQMYRRVADKSFFPDFVPVASTCYQYIEPKCPIMVVNQGAPFHKSGYGLRTLKIMNELQRAGFRPQLIARPGYPADRPNEKTQDLHPGNHVISDESIEHHYFVDDYCNMSNAPLEKYFNLSYSIFFKLFERVRPPLVHAVTNHFGALPAIWAASQLNIPTVFEARGSWELTRVSRGDLDEKSELFNIQSRLERKCITDSNVFFAINKELWNYFKGQEGTDEMNILENGVDMNNFVQSRQNAVERKKSKYSLRLIYAGAVVDYEGLDILVRAVSRLRRQGVDSVYLDIAGDGSFEPTLRALINDLNLNSHICLHGRVSKDELDRLFSSADLMCLPRRNWGVCNIVAPLKPYEAMQAELPLLVSSVAPLARVVRESGAGRIFEADNVTALADQIKFFISSPLGFEAMRKAGPQYVRSKGNWTHRCASLLACYDRFST